MLHWHVVVVIKYFYDLVQYPKQKFFAFLFSESRFQGPVVRRVDNFIQRINPYPVDKIC